MTTTAPAPDGLTIRHVERADLLDVHHIEQATFPQPWPFRAFERFLEEPGFLVAVEGGSVVGYVVADVIPNHGRDIGHIKDLAVHPEQRGRGVGTRLLDSSLSVLTSHGARRTKLEVRAGNEGAQRLYRRFGFERHHVIPGYYDDGEDAFVLIADLGDR